MRSNLTSSAIFLLLSACAFDEKSSPDTDGTWTDGYDEGYNNGREAGYTEATEAFEARLAALESQVATIQPVVDEADLLLDYVSVDEEDQNGPAVKFTGANVYVQSGSGATDDGGSLTGLGNLVIGYDETRADSSDSASVCYSSTYLDGSGVNLPTDTLTVDVRSGSHNLIVGRYNNRTSYGGFVAGQCNELRGVANTIVGGGGNIAEGWHVAIGGGIYNYATDEHTVVSGGALNWANAFAATVGSGLSNTASNDYSVAAGGAYNVASGLGSSVSGGNGNTADGTYTSVVGGADNQATGDSATVLAGFENRALANYSAVSGGQSNTANGEYGSLSGGFNNGVTSNSPWGWVGGGTGNEAMDDLAVVLGGYNNKGSYELCVMLGGSDGFCTATRSIDP